LLPNWIFTQVLTAGPLYGGIITQSPSRYAVLEVASITRFSLPSSLSPSNTFSKFWLSFPSLLYSCDVNVAREAKRSNWQIIASDTPGTIIPGHQTTKGTRVPASYKLYLPPRHSPAGVWFPSNSTA